MSYLYKKTSGFRVYKGTITPSTIWPSPKRNFIAHTQEDGSLSSSSSSSSLSSSSSSESSSSSSSLSSSSSSSNSSSSSSLSISSSSLSSSSSSSNGSEEIFPEGCIRNQTEHEFDNYNDALYYAQNDLVSDPNNHTYDYRLAIYDSNLPFNTDPENENVYWGTINANGDVGMFMANVSGTWTYNDGSREFAFVGQYVAPDIYFILRHQTGPSFYNNYYIVVGSDLGNASVYPERYDNLTLTYNSSAGPSSYLANPYSPVDSDGECYTKLVDLNGGLGEGEYYIIFEDDVWKVGACATDTGHHDHHHHHHHGHHHI